MKKVSVHCMYDYIMGYLRYGHLEGELELTDEEFEDFKNDPIGFYQCNDTMFDDLNFVLDSYRIEDYGDINEILYEEIE